MRLFLFDEKRRGRVAAIIGKQPRIAGLSLCKDGGGAQLPSQNIHHSVRKKIGRGLRLPIHWLDVEVDREFEACDNQVGNGWGFWRVFRDQGFQEPHQVVSLRLLDPQDEPLAVVTILMLRPANE